MTSPGRWLDRRVGPGRARRVVDAALLACLLAAAALALSTGLDETWLLAVGAATVAFHVAYWRRVRRALVADLPAAHDAGSELASRARDLAGEMGVPVPDVRVVRSDVGVALLRDGDRSVVIAGADVVDALDAGERRAVLAHELAHLAAGHLRWPDLRPAVPALVGYAVFWAVALQRAGPPVALAGTVLFLVAATTRRSDLTFLAVVALSLGAVVLPVALVALADRLQECQADDVAVRHVDPATLARGLRHVTAGEGREGHLPASVGGTAPPSPSRGAFARLTARHPSLAHRLERLGLAPGDAP